MYRWGNAWRGCSVTVHAALTRSGAPQVGEFQCYDRRALASLAAAAQAAGHPEWGYSGPHDAGTYNSTPEVRRLRRSSPSCHALCWLVLLWLYVEADSLARALSHIQIDVVSPTHCAEAE